MATQAVTLLLGTLFVIVAGLLGYGVYAFGRQAETERVPGGRRANMQREVLWTGLASALLLAAFLYAR